MMLSMGTEQDSNYEGQGERRKGAKGWEKEKDPQNNRMQRQNIINNEHDAQVTGFHYINENLIAMAKKQFNYLHGCVRLRMNFQIPFLKYRGG